VGEIRRGNITISVQVPRVVLREHLAVMYTRLRAKKKEDDSRKSLKGPESDKSQ